MFIVRETLIRFRNDIEEILKDNLYEIIIHGSYALSEFTPHKGDLDYTVLTEADIDLSHIDRLFALHDSYRQERELLLYQLEGTFYPRHVLLDITSAFFGCYIGTGRKGWRSITVFQNSFMDLKTMEDKGIRLLGNPLEFYRPTADEITDEQKTTVRNLKKTIRNENQPEIGIWCSLIHWCARTIVYVCTEEIVSKGSACRWCQSNLRANKFEQLFMMAEKRRYPYGDESASDEFRTMCGNLLAYTEALVTNNEGPLLQNQLEHA